MTTIILGNGNNLSVSDDNSIGDTIIVGNGINDISEREFQSIRHGHPRQRRW